MSKHLSRFIPVLVVVSLVTGCADGPSKQTIGTGVGAVSGALIGSLFGRGLGTVAASAVGGLLGGWAGSTAGKAWDRADKEKAAEALDKAQEAPVGETVAWNNPETGNSGAVTPVGESVDEAGNRCRDYQSSITVDGKDDVVHGTACRQPDGSWAVRK